MPSKKYKEQENKHEKAFRQGAELVGEYPLFRTTYERSHINTRNDYQTNSCPKGGLAVVDSLGIIHARPGTMLLQPEEWAYVIAHCLLHLAFGHFQDTAHYNWPLWNISCDCMVDRFLHDMKFGAFPQAHEPLFRQLQHLGRSVKSEQQLYEDFQIFGTPTGIPTAGMTLTSECDMLISDRQPTAREKIDWQDLFSRDLQSSVFAAVEMVVNGSQGEYPRANENSLEIKEARNWFITKFPLLAALASAFEIIEDGLLCQRMDISVAAIHVERQEIYINPHAGLNGQELRFVMAHEFLHAGLRHEARCSGRDPYLWNIACDYVINGWLLEMGVGTMPTVGGMYDPELKNESAEAIYDRITRDLRRYRKLLTMRGRDQSDILDGSYWGGREDGVNLDEFYRNCLSQGLLLHEQMGRGMLAAGLIEEIRALNQPAIPWDVELAQWFDAHFPPIEQRRSYARLSRRQSATPDIPRPRWVRPEEINTQQRRTYGVLLDTSGSMETEVLAQALGAIASYSIAHEVDAVRVVFCDAITYDQGYMPVEDIAQSVKVRGRGGTILQPGINLLEQAEDFPANGPILIITDGYCDRLTVRREHAYLLPKKGILPFPPRGPVFKISSPAPAAEA